LVLEFLLNIVWVLLVTASVLAWRRLSSSRRPVTALVALICILVLLFPVISATDDLHVAEVAMEDSGRKVLRHLLPDTSSGIQGSHSTFAPPVPLFCLATPLALIVAPAHQQPQLVSTSSYRDSVSDRAPPALV
jgi:hypothetical protein